MTSTSGRRVLLPTKLHQPRTTADLVHRPRLKQLLNSGLDRPLILVAAPAGFGKSTLLSAWLDTCDLPHAWVSLDEADDDLGSFLAYFLAATQSLFPDALPQTSALLAGITLPEAAVVARSLIGELDALQREFILVLDDYYLIREQPVHELLRLLLQHPPRGMHLVIATRLDPPLPLGLLRARNQLAEVRSQDLRFSRTEISAFTQQALGVPLAEDALSVLAERTEGWAAGLRLAMLALRQSGDVGSQLASLRTETRYVHDYLLHEVLAQVSPAMKGFLLKTSILDQMCGPLCQELIGADELACQPEECLAWLEQASMFTVALDARGEWYRYHDLFRGFLRDQLAHQATAAEIAALHARASAWFAREGSLDEALQHALLGRDMPGAVRLMAKHRHALMDSEQWQILERLLRLFPADTVAEYPDLLLANAWLTELNRSDPQYVKQIVDRAAELIAQRPDQPLPHGVHLSGEIDTLRAMAGLMAADDPEQVIALAQRALATTPRAWYFVRAVAWLRLALAYQMAGRLGEAYATLAEAEPEDVAQNDVVHARVAGSRGFVQWIAGDLPAIAQPAAHLVAVGEAYRRHESLGWGHYFLSSVAYHRNDLATAEAHAQTGEEIRYTGRPMAYLQSAFVYASICQARGQPARAQEKLDLAFDFLRETGSEGLRPLARAFQAELAVRQGDLSAAGHWATTMGPFLPLTAMPYFYAPQLTLPKILLAQDTPASRQQAAEALSTLHAFVTSIHSIRFTIEVLALQALLHDAQGDQGRAVVHLQQALALAEPGGFIRLFVDLGPRLASLLTRLRPAGNASGYMSQILEAFGRSTPVIAQPNEAPWPKGQAELVEPLTDRELEVLAFLAQRLSNKEIARALVISPLTVKRHATNIYGKLEVRGRREAVAKAIRLGLL